MSKAWKSGVILELQFDYARSSGPGGQHVNKTETAVLVRFDVAASQYLTDIQKQAIFERLSNKVTKEGHLILRSEESRDRLRNKDEAIKRFLELLEKAFFVPKARKKTAPTRSSQRKRLLSKKVHGQKKQLRGKVSKGDE